MTKLPRAEFAISAAAYLNFNVTNFPLWINLCTPIWLLYKIGIVKVDFTQKGGDTETNIKAKERLVRMKNIYNKEK